MKLVLIAAALAATPALAQTTTPTDSSGMNGATTGQTTQPTTGDQSTANGQAMPNGQMQNGQQMPNGQMQNGQQMPNGNSGQMSPNGTPMGGYQPQGSATSGSASAGAPAQSPGQAYPAPAPLAHYPPCKPGQYDQCKQVEGSHAGRHMMKGHMAKGHRMTAHHAAARKPMAKKTTTTTSTTSSQ